MITTKIQVEKFFRNFPVGGQFFGVNFVLWPKQILFSFLGDQDLCFVFFVFGPNLDRTLIYGKVGAGRRYLLIVFVTSVQMVMNTAMMTRMTMFKKRVMMIHV